jgi:hypothetical protein
MPDPDMSSFSDGRLETLVVSAKLTPSTAAPQKPN